MEFTYNKDYIWQLIGGKILIDEVNKCWHYQGTIYAEGYGYIKIDGVRYRVSRLSAFVHLSLDMNDPSQQANHTLECKSKDCINPDHLYIGNQGQNVRDTVRLRTHKEARKTHCPKGHEYTPENTRIYRFMRYCRACKRERGKSK